jgi:predicted RNA-binding protein YlxR (DUF448 family)
MPRTPRLQKRTRTCVGCGKRDPLAVGNGLVRLVKGAEGFEFDLARRARGRGAYVHADPACLRRAPAGLARALRLAQGSAPSRVGPSELAGRLGAACDRRIASLLAAARRIRAVRSSESPSRGSGGADALTIVAVDAGAAAWGPEVQTALAGGRVFVWGTRGELGALVGAAAAASCAVEHKSFAAALSRARAAADAASVAIQATTQRSRRSEAR